MAKIFSVLTLLIALGATFLNFQSKSLVEKLKTSAETEHRDLDVARGDVKKAKTAQKEAEDKVTKAEEDLTAAKAKEQQAADELKKSMADLESTKGLLTTANATIEGMKGKPPEPGVDVPALQAKVTAAEAAKAEAEAKAKTQEIEVQELKTTLETLTVRLKDSEEKAAKQVTVIKKYKDHVMVQGTRGTVTAVNSGWGFCVLSIGDKQGAATNRILIVTRDGQAIGKVKITNVEASQSVADIIPGSFRKGVYVEPGDRVIYTGEDKVRVEEAEAAPAGGNTPPPSPTIPSGLVPPLPVQ